MPENMNHKLFESLYNLGRDFATSGYLNADLLQTLAKPERYPSYLIPMFKLLTKTPLLSFYWDGQLKENGVYDQRFAQPYVTSHGIT
jgi:hypothetical protein